MKLTVITPPGEPAVPLGEMKDYLRIGHDGEDGLVTALTQAATARIEAAVGIALVTRILERCVSAWPATIGGRGFAVRPHPVNTLVSVTLEPVNGAPVTDVTDRFSLSCGRICLRPWSMAPPIPAGGRAILRFEAGYGGPGDLPGDLVHAVKLLVADSYRVGRSSETSSDALPKRVSDILAAHREVRL